MDTDKNNGGIKRHKKSNGQCKPSIWFTVVAPNGKILVTSETYRSISGMEKGIKALIKTIVNKYHRDNTDKQASYFVPTKLVQK